MASQEYKDLLEPVLIKAIGQEPRKRALRCPETRSRSEPSPFDRSFLDFLTAAFLWPQRLWESSKEEKLAGLLPLHPAAQLLQNEMLALHPFTNLAPESLSRLAVAVEIPSWLMGTEEACHIASAAERTFGRLIRLERPPPSAYTTAGYELPASQVLALGAAQSAKEGIELQVDDCGEPEECQELRRKADLIAGTYRPLRPSTWPVAGLRHAEL